MTITNEPLQPDFPVKFTVNGFPEEEAVLGSVQRFYKLKPDAFRKFTINNAFAELIMSGSVDSDGNILQFEHHERPKKHVVETKND